MPRALGVTCSGSTAYLAIVDASSGASVRFVDVGPPRIEPVEAGDPGDALVRTLADWRRALTLVAPDAIALLLPESDKRTQKVHASWAPRIEAETLVAVSAGLAGVPFDRLSRGTVRSKLQLAGKLDDAAKIEPKQGIYWTHRALAFLAAKALAVRAEDGGWPARHASGAAVLREISDGVAR